MQRLDFISAADDATLAIWSQAGNAAAADALVRRYWPAINSRVRNLRVPGTEGDDLVQEALLGLHTAIRTYDASRGVVFAHFAARCVRSTVASAIKAAYTHKNMLLSRSVPLDAYDADRAPGGRLRFSGCAPCLAPDGGMADTAFRAWLISTVRSALRSFEWDVVVHLAAGCSYREVSEAMRCRFKQVDNAVTHARGKAHRLLALLGTDEAGCDSTPVLA